MIVEPSNPFSQSGTSRRAAAALLLSIALALTAVPPAHARTGIGGAFVEGMDRIPREGFLHFLLRLFSDAGGTMDPNGLH